MKQTKIVVRHAKKTSLPICVQLASDMRHLSHVVSYQRERFNRFIGDRYYASSLTTYAVLDVMSVSKRGMGRNGANRAMSKGHETIGGDIWIARSNGDIYDSTMSKWWGTLWQQISTLTYHLHGRFALRHFGTRHFVTRHFGCAIPAAPFRGRPVKAA